MNSFADSSLSVLSRAIVFVAIMFSICLAGSAGRCVSAESTGDASAAIIGFMENNCYDCHDGRDAEAGLDLVSMAEQFDTDRVNQTFLHDDATFAKWTRVFDRVREGEMPPPEDSSVDKRERAGFLKATGRWLRSFRNVENRRTGRVKARRLTNIQLERSLHDLLGIDIPLATLMSEEPRSEGFVAISDIQSMSHFQLEQHLQVVDAGLDEAIRRGLGKSDLWEKKLPAKQLVRRRPRSRTREPELIDGHSVVWSGGVIYYGRLPSTTAKEDGWYRFKIRAKALKSPKEHGVWCSVRTGPCISSAPLLGFAGAFEATNKPKDITIETWLPAGHMLELRPGDITLKRATFRGGQIGTGEGGPQNVPGVAVESIVMQRVHRDAGDRHLRQLLFGNLNIVKPGHPTKASVVSKSPKQDAGRLMHDFASRAFRRPVKREEIEPYIALVHAALKDGGVFHEALRTGYRALLCSPRFLYLQENPGKLDQYAIASRLSFMLWNRAPDEELRKLAADSKLNDAKTIERQVDRMLADPKGASFVTDLANQWLDLNLIDFTEPDRRLYPGFDPIVQQSMLDETHTYLQYMLDKDLSVSHLIDSDFTFLNNRLARYYKIDNVNGDRMRRVKLKPDDHRGGLLTHGSIMKVTANGTTTSPVVRGVWVSHRLLGQEIPPPPDSVPAIEPDIRGAKTIREILEKHQADQSCAVCHVKIDPPGFALENYDPSGRWRDVYVSKRGRKRNRVPIDSSSRLPDGREFKDVDEFQKLVTRNAKPLARNVVSRLLTYGTGAPISFADRVVVNEIADNPVNQDYGFRSLLKAVVTSRIFLSK